MSVLREATKCYLDHFLLFSKLIIANEDELRRMVDEGEYKGNLRYYQSRRIKEQYVSESLLREGSIRAKKCGREINE